MRNILPGLQSIIRVISTGVASWLLIHIFAFLGIFVAIAYPIWWLIMPGRALCLFCSSRRVGERCPACRKSVEAGDITPNSFYSAMVNSITLLIITIFSVLIVFVESKALIYLSQTLEQKTVSFVIPSRNKYKLNEVFPLHIELKDIRTDINAIQADLSFDPALLEVVEIRTDNSFATLFLQNEYDNEKGYARLSGGLPNPGYSKSTGFFGTVYLKAKATGVVEVEYLPTSLVLANDGEGTNVLKELGTVSYIILPPDSDQGSGSGVELSETTDDAPELALDFNTEGTVLGTSTVNTDSDKDKLNPITVLLKIDQFIVDRWEDLLGLDN